MSQLMIDRLITLLATGFGAGFSPKGPGTAGTLIGVPIFLLANRLPIIGYMAFVLILTAVACIIADRAGVLLDETDSPKIVIDEIVGFLITMTWLPTTWQWLLAGFLTFRVLDIFKPWPIAFVESKISGGTGVVMDDVCAGLIANIFLQVTLSYSASWL
jgi:phosphatidylglycerophosphatase A